MTSKSIKNGAVKSVDIKDGAVKSVDIKDDSLTGGDVADGSLTGSGLEPALLTDATRGATTGGGPLVCVNDSGSFKACADASVSLNRAGRVLALVDGTADSGQAGQVRVSTCALFADGSSISAEQPIAAPLSPAEHFSFAAVSPVLGQGTHSIQLRCRNNDPGAAPRIFGSSVTTVVLGPG